MNVTKELMRDLAILEKVIVTVETAATAKPGDEIGRIKGVKIASRKLTIVLIEE